MFFIRNRQLLPHRLFVYLRNNPTNKPRRHTHAPGIGRSCFENLVEAVAVYDRHAVLRLVFADLSRHLHSFGQQLHKPVVDRIDMRPVITHGIVGRNAFRHAHMAYQASQFNGGKLLRTVAQRLGRSAVALDDQAVESDAYGLLCQRLDQIGTAGHVAWVAYDRQRWYAPAQLDRYRPMRGVTVERLLVAAEAPVYGSQTSYSGIIYSLNGPYPQFDIRVDRVLDQNGYVDALQRIGYLLHGERVGRRAGADPDGIYP